MHTAQPRAAVSTRIHGGFSAIAGVPVPAAYSSVPISLSFLFLSSPSRSDAATGEAHVQPPPSSRSRSIHVVTSRNDLPSPSLLLALCSLHRGSALLPIPVTGVASILLYFDHPKQLIYERNRPTVCEDGHEDGM